MSRILFVILFVSAFLSKSFADDIKFKASAKTVVSKNEQFRLTFELNAKGSGFKAPDLSDFNVLMGPSTSSSSSIQIINGQMAQNVSYSYTYVLQAKKEGKFEIGSASINVDGTTYSSKSLSIEVVAGTASQNNSNSNSSGGNQVEGVNGDELFVRMHVSRSSLLKGEYLIATLKVYTKVNLAGFEDMKYPSYSGFWKEDIPTPNQIQLVNENVNGEIYGVGVISQVILYPQKSGEITIDPFELECVVQKRVNSNRNGFFNSFFGGYKNFKVKAKSPAVKINVKDLPANAPAGFNGAVGSYILETSIDKNEVKANDPITYKLKIKGRGNLKLVDPPEINFPADFEVYDPNTSENIQNNAAGSSGTKTIDYLIIPRHAGTFTIPSIKFSYFDITSNQYKTLTSDEYEIKVEKGEGDNNTSVVSNFSKEDVQYIGKDIRYIKTNNLKLRKKDTFIFGSLEFILSYIVSFLLFVGIIIWKRKQIKQRANIALVKNKKAKSTAQKRLKLASKYLKENNTELFYTEVARALWGYLSDKLNITLAELTKDNVSEALKNKGIEEVFIARFTDALNVCEYARYAPGENFSQKEQVYADAANIISELEQKIR